MEIDKINLKKKRNLENGKDVHRRQRRDRD
jgi:hypothetical protein